MPPTGPQTRRWSRKEYYRLADLGFFANERVELLWGKVVQMPAMKNEHMVAVGLTEEALRHAFGPGYWVRIQGPLNLSAVSAPEPDLAVVSGKPRDFQDHPDTALLVVEVSDTTLRFDRNVKAATYAAAGIQEYWIVNLPDRCLEVLRDPKPNTKQPKKSRYSQREEFASGEEISPLANPKSQIKVDDLLP